MDNQQSPAPPSEKDKEFAQELVGTIMAGMKAGATRQEIVQNIAGAFESAAAGSEVQVNRADLERMVAGMVDDVYAGVAAAAEMERLTSGNIRNALVGGCAAAVAGGLLWGVIATATGYEIGYMASGLGLLAGYAVVVSAGGRRGRLLQLAAVLASAVGIAVGKYFIFVHYLRQLVLERYGAAAAAQVSIFSGVTFNLFLNALGSLVSGYDALWLGLAVIAAWRIPRGFGIRLPQSRMWTRPSITGPSPSPQAAAPSPSRLAPKEKTLEETIREAERYLEETGKKKGP